MEKRFQVLYKEREVVFFMLFLFFIFSFFFLS